MSSKLFGRDSVIVLYFYLQPHYFRQQMWTLNHLPVMQIKLHPKRILKSKTVHFKFKPNFRRNEKRVNKLMGNLDILSAVS